MYIRHLPDGGGWNEEFLDGVEEFLNFAKSQDQYMDKEKIMCPCTACKNGKFKDVETVRVHLFKKGFIDNYYRWISHGESPLIETPLTQDRPRSDIDGLSFFGVGMDIFDNLNPCKRMVFDAAGPSFVPPQWFDVGTSDVPVNDINSQGEGLESTTELAEEIPYQTSTFGLTNDSTSYLSNRFFDVLKASEDPIYHGCGVSQLSTVSSFLSFKADYNLPQAGYDRLMYEVGRLLPSDHSLPASYYESGKLVADLGLPVKKIHVCPEGCMLFWKEDLNATHCKFCNSPRYKQQQTRKGKSIPRKVLRYLPLIPRLQRLYAMEDTAPHRRWHAEHETEEGLICHPSDAEAWKHLDNTFSNFASEVRNVRLFIEECGADALSKHFLQWFKDYVFKAPQHTVDPLILSLAYGPSRKVLSWPAYYINGYKYETLERGKDKVTMNSGVCLQASVGETQSDFFGMIEEILGFEFTGFPCKKIVLFKCLWYDHSIRGTNIHAQYRLQEINVRRRYTNYEPFVLAQQCIQVYYASYPGASRSRADWRAVCKIKPQRRVEERWTMKKIPDEPLQQDGIEVIGEQFVGVTVDQLPTNLSVSSELDEGAYSEDSDNDNFEIENENEEEDFPSESDTEVEYVEDDHVVEDDDDTSD